MKLEVTGIDPIGREELIGIFSADVRRGVTQATSQLLPRDDRAEDCIGSPQCPISLSHLPSRDTRLDPSRADDFALEREAIGLQDFDAILRT